MKNENSTHICLISKEPLPNLIPLFDLKPRNVLLLTSPEMASKAETMRRLIQEYYFQIQESDFQVKVVAIEAFSFECVRDVILQTLENSHDDNFILNVTGGTKIMSLAAFDTFRSLSNGTILYVDTANNRLLKLSPQTEECPLPDVMSINTILKAYGYTIAQRSAAPMGASKRQTADQIAQLAVKYPKALGELNKFAREAEKSLFADIQQGALKVEGFSEMVNVLKDAGILSFDGGKRLVFRGEEDRFFSCGGWLESYYASSIIKLKMQNLITDAAYNVAINGPIGTKNEFDAVFTVKNRLHIVECKTAYLDTNKSDDAAYKLEALRDLIGGVYAKAILVSARSLRRADVKRCEEFGITVAHGNGILNPENILREWSSI